jgi:hypothetical protein
MSSKPWESKSSASSKLSITAPDLPQKVPEGDCESPGQVPIPLIIVEGFGGGSGNRLWGEFADHLNAGFQDFRRRETHFVK